MSEQVKAIVTEIAERRGIYFIAKQLGKQYTQIVRMIETGRCQPEDFKELERLHGKYVPRQTLQNVTTTSYET